MKLLIVKVILYLQNPKQVQLFPLKKNLYCGNQVNIDKDFWVWEISTEVRSGFLINAVFPKFILCCAIIIKSREVVDRRFSNFHNSANGMRCLHFCTLNLHLQICLFHTSYKYWKVPTHLFISSTHVYSKNLLVSFFQTWTSCGGKSSRNYWIDWWTSCPQ